MTTQIATMSQNTSLEYTADALQLVTSSPLDLPATVFQDGLDRRSTNRKALMAWIKSALVEGVDFGSIKTKRGPTKPSLFKPGAEKICGMLGVTAKFPSLYEYERVALSAIELQHIILRCELVDAHNRIVADGVGARSLKQDFGDLNKALKMASKSAHIDATLRMAGLSEVFTQDLEDTVLETESVTTSSTAPIIKPPATIERITTEQLTQLQGLLYQHRIDSEKFQAWLTKLCDAKGLQPINHLAEIPAVMFAGIVKKIPDFAYSAA